MTVAFLCRLLVWRLTLLVGPSVELPTVLGIPKIPTLEELFEEFVAFVRGGAEDMLLIIIRMISTSFLPTGDVLARDVLLLFAGGTLGLALLIVRVMVVIVAFVIILTALRDNSRRISRVLTTVFYLILFQFAFIPAYAMAVNVVRSFVNTMIDFAAKDSEPENVLEALTSNWPQDLFTALISLPVVAALAFLATGIGVTVYMLTISVYLMYPLSISARMLGWNYPFNAFNALLITTLLSPPMIAFGLLLPLMVGKIPFPDAAVSIVQIFALLVGLLIAILSPFVIFVISYFKTAEVFGSVDAKVSGKVDIGSMPFLTGEQTIDGIAEANSASSMSFSKAVSADLSTLPLDLDYSSRGAFVESLGNTTSDAVATGFAATGQPVKGMVVKGGWRAFYNYVVK